MAPTDSTDFRAVFAVRVFEGGDYENGTEHFFTRGKTIPGDLLGEAQRKRYLAMGAIVADDGAALPPENPAEAPTLTQPNGDPVVLAEGEELETGFKAAGSHKEADAMAADLGVTFPEKTKLDDKNEALSQVYAARAAGEPAPEATGEDISTLSDEELIQRGIDFGHAEDEMIEMGHDELVLFVAEAMARQGSTTAQQEASVRERDAASE